jgi:hypothetical protein
MHDNRCACNDLAIASNVPPGARCAHCFAQMMEARDAVVAENNALRETLRQERLSAGAEVKRLQGIIEGLSGRVVSQSDLLSRRAEVGGGHHTITLPDGSKKVFQDGKLVQEIQAPGEGGSI